uniref:unspecific monooxygenase n=1 Tax=Helicoverpa armigera TaxID=29058 RepID=F4YCW0_HELAM|nr:gossypol-induced cytochrome P450 [Helicoverpa armigera]
MITSLLLTAVFVIIFTIYLVSKKKFQYWEKRKVPHLPPVPLLGNFGNFILQRQFLGYTLQQICGKFPNVPYVGAYFGTEPALIVQDPEHIKLVMTKDFYFFSSREISEYADRERFTQNLFSTSGNKWKVLRQNLTPVFTSAKMKNMFHLIEKCSHVFEDFLDKEAKSNEVEMRALVARYTMDCIGTCAFGVETKTMNVTENNPFTAVGNSIFMLSRVQGFKFVLRGIYPSLFYLLGFRTLPPEVNAFFSNLMTGVFKGRNYTPTSRNDFVDFVLKWKQNKTMTGDSLTNMKYDSQKKVTLEVDDDLLVAQCFIFFAAGYETSATTLSFTLYELAKHPEAQKRAIAEVDDYLRRHNNELKYECLSEMPFVEACFDETLRKYPVLSLLTREVVEDYTFPSGLKVEKGLRIFLPLYHLHHNPEFFPDPEEYRPERFLPENKDKIKPYTYMPFGEGPRLCIGMRFAKMQMTAGIITLLKKYRLELAPGMPQNIEFEPNSFVSQVAGGINLKMIKRESWEGRLLKNLEKAY